MKVRVSTRLDCAPDAAWEAVQTTALLEHVARPILRLAPCYGRSFPERWEEGLEVTVALRLFGVLPAGRHTIRIRTLDPGRRVIETSESGGMVPVWNHRIEVARVDSGDAVYTDDVDVRAGWRTPLVWLFAHFFYRHRQRRWRRLASQLATRTSTRSTPAGKTDS